MGWFNPFLCVSSRSNSAPGKRFISKSIDGVNKAIDEYTATGADLLSKEVSLDVNGTRVRLDAAFKLNGETILMEVKMDPMLVSLLIRL